MTKEASLEAVNSALSKEVRKLQEELKQADKEIISMSRQLNIMRLTLEGIAAMSPSETCGCEMCIAARMANYAIAKAKRENGNG